MKFFYKLFFVCSLEHQFITISFNKLNILHNLYKSKFILQSLQVAKKLFSLRQRTFNTSISSFEVDHPTLEIICTKKTFEYNQYHYMSFTIIKIKSNCTLGPTNQPKVIGRGSKNKGFTGRLQSRKESRYNFKNFKLFC